MPPFFSKWRRGAAFAAAGGVLWTLFLAFGPELFSAYWAPSNFKSVTSPKTAIAPENVDGGGAASEVNSTLQQRQALVLALREIMNEVERSPVLETSHQNDGTIDAEASTPAAPPIDDFRTPVPADASQDAERVATSPNIVRDNSKNGRPPGNDFASLSPPEQSPVVRSPIVSTPTIDATSRTTTSKPLSKPTTLKKLGVFPGQKFSICHFQNFAAEVGANGQIHLTTTDKSVPNSGFRGFELMAPVQTAIEISPDCTIALDYTTVEGTVRIGISVMVGE